MANWQKSRTSNCGANEIIAEIVFTIWALRWNVTFCLRRTRTRAGTSRMSFSNWVNHQRRRRKKSQHMVQTFLQPPPPFYRSKQPGQEKLFEGTTIYQVSGPDSPGRGEREWLLGTGIKISFPMIGNGNWNGNSILDFREREWDVVIPENDREWELHHKI